MRPFRPGAQSAARPPVPGAMDLEPVNLTELVGVTLGLLTILIPIFGVTLRFAAKPLVDALVQSGMLTRAAQPAADGELGRLQRRVLELEQQVAKLKAAEPLASLDAELSAELKRVRS